MDDELPPGFVLDDPQSNDDLPPGFVLDEPSAPIAPEPPVDQAALTRQYQDEVTALLNDKTKTTADIVAHMTQYGSQPQQDTLDQLRIREQMIASGADYRGQSVIDADHPDQIEAQQPQLEVGGVDAFGRGLYQGLALGFGDEIGAGLNAVGNSVAGVFGGGNGQDFADFYTQRRDEYRGYDEAAGDQHPIAYTSGEIVGAAAPALVGGAGVSAGRLVARGAAEGAVYGAGKSEADTIGGMTLDAAKGGAMGLAGGVAANRLGAIVSPRVAPIVDRLMRQAVELTPTQILRAGGRVSRAIGGGVETLGRRGVVTNAAMEAAESRGNVSLNRSLADAVVDRDVSRAVAARQLEGESASEILPVVAKEAAALKAQARMQADQIAAAQAAGLTVRPRDPGLIARASDASNGVDFLASVRGADTGMATASDLRAALSRRTTDGAVHPDQYAGDLSQRMNGLIGDAGSVMGRSGAGGTDVERIAALLLSSGSSLAGDLAVASIYTRPGLAIANRLLTGRQGPVPKAIRGIATRLSPLAGVGASINTDYADRE